MIYFKTNGTLVTFIHYMPFDEKYGMKKTEAELLETGHLVEKIPEYEGETPTEKGTELHYKDGEFWFELVDIPQDNRDQEIEDLKNRVEELENMNQTNSEENK